MIIPTRKFAQQLERLDPKIQKHVVAKLRQVDDHLAIWSHERLTERTGYKLRVGDWRVLYELDRPNRRIVLLNVGHRSQIYKY